MLSPLGLEELDVQPDGVAFGAEGLDDFGIVAGTPPTRRPEEARNAPGVTSG
jgi:hypothetical protein